MRLFKRIKKTTKKSYKELKPVGKWYKKEYGAKAIRKKTLKAFKSEMKTRATESRAYQSGRYARRLEIAKTKDRASVNPIYRRQRIRPIKSGLESSNLLPLMPTRKKKVMI